LVGWLVTYVFIWLGQGMSHSNFVTNEVVFPAADNK
jgi:hypothetical protein